MTSSLCSAGERPERRALRRPSRWLSVLLALPLLAASAPLLGQPSGAPGADAELRAPQCPTFTNLCVNAQKTGVFDLQEGVADLEGDVRGYMESQELTFHSEQLRAFRNTEGEWKRLLLSTNVRMSQPGRRISAANGVIEEETALFYGGATMVDNTAVSQSEEVFLEHEAQRATLKGSPNNPVRMQYTAPPEEPTAAQFTDTPEGPGTPPKPPQPTKATAQKAVVEEESRQVTLTGKVRVDMPDRQIQMEAESVVIQFGEDNEVAGFQARGDVVIIQPGRRLTSDSARSQNKMQTILLQGRAKAQQQGQFELNSDRMEVFTDPKKGAVRSEDRQRPINLSLDLTAGKPYKLDQTKLQPLADRGVPPATLQKLSPILGKSFGNLDSFRNAASDVLTQEEIQRFLPTIIDQAH